MHGVRRACRCAGTASTCSPRWPNSSWWVWSREYHVFEYTDSSLKNLLSSYLRVRSILSCKSWQNTIAVGSQFPHLLSHNLLTYRTSRIYQNLKPNTMYMVHPVSNIKSYQMHQNYDDLFCVLNWFGSSAYPSFVSISCHFCAVRPVFVDMFCIKCQTGSIIIRPSKVTHSTRVHFYRVSTKNNTNESQLS